MVTEYNPRLGRLTLALAALTLLVTQGARATQPRLIDTLKIHASNPLADDVASAQEAIARVATENKNLGRYTGVLNLMVRTQEKSADALLNAAKTFVRHERGWTDTRFVAMKAVKAVFDRANAEQVVDPTITALGEAYKAMSATCDATKAASNEAWNAFTVLVKTQLGFDLAPKTDLP